MQQLFFGISQTKETEEYVNGLRLKLSPISMVNVGHIMTQVTQTNCRHMFFVEQVY